MFWYLDRNNKQCLFFDTLILVYLFGICSVEGHIIILDRKFLSRNRQECGHKMKGLGQSDTQFQDEKCGRELWCEAVFILHTFKCKIKG
jgi:hypothetical protein